MSTTFNASMFESIKDALKQEKQTSGLKDMLRLDAGHTYIVRLIPNVKSPKDTFYHYYNHGWKSVATGQFVSAISPTTWGDPDPIAQTRFALAKEATTDEDKKKVALLNRKENWLAKVYVVSDPAHPENNNKVKFLRFGRQIHKVIMEGLDGEEAKEIGSRMFDFTANGVNLKIKAEKQGDFTTFVATKFSNPCEIAGMTPEKVQEIYNDPLDVTKVFTVKSYKELETMLEEHYFAKGSKKKAAKAEKAEKAAEPTPEEDNVPMDDPASAEVPATAGEPAASEELLDDSKVKELLKGLD